MAFIKVVANVYIPTTPTYTHNWLLLESFTTNSPKCNALRVSACGVCILLDLECRGCYFGFPMYRFNTTVFVCMWVLSCGLVRA
jgi:hypothetical protein